MDLELPNLRCPAREDGQHSWTDQFFEFVMNHEGYQRPIYRCRSCGAGVEEEAYKLLIEKALDDASRD